MSRTDSSRYSDAAAVTHPAVQPFAARLGRSESSTGATTATTVDTQAMERTLATGPRAVTAESRGYAAARTRTVLTPRPAASERKQMSAGMTTTLSAELEGRVARDLVADIVRAVVDESRQTSPDGTAESLMAEARQRLERFIRARAGR